MPGEVLAAVIEWAVPFLLGGVVTGCVTYTRVIKRRSDAMVDGLRCLLRAEIIHMHAGCMSRGHCPIYAKEALARVYDAYRALGGNDVATALSEQMINMPDAPPALPGQNREAQP